MLDELFIEEIVDKQGKHDTPYAIVLSHSIDGHVCEVFGESAEEAEEAAKKIIRLISLGIKAEGVINKLNDDNGCEYEIGFDDNLNCWVYQVNKEPFEQVLSICGIPGDLDGATCNCCGKSGGKC